MTIPDLRIAEARLEGVDHLDKVGMTAVAEVNGMTPRRQLGGRHPIRTEILGILLDDQLQSLQQLLAGSRGAIKIDGQLMPLLQTKGLRGVAKALPEVVKQHIREIMKTGEKTDATDVVLKRRSTIEMIRTDREDQRKELNHRETIEEEETILETTDEAERGLTSVPPSAEVCWLDRFSWQIFQKQKPLRCGLRYLGITESRPFAWYQELLLSCKSTRFKRQLVTEHQL